MFFVVEFDFVVDELYVVSDECEGFVESGVAFFEEVGELVDGGCEFGHGKFNEVVLQECIVLLLVLLLLLL